MKKLITLISFSCALLTFESTVWSQSFDWAQQIGGSDHDVALQVAVDDAKNVYTIGRFRGTADFDPGTGTYNLTSTGSWDVFVSKLDASGNFVWARNFGGTGTDMGYAITSDASENIYITGTFSLTVDFDPGAGTSNLISAGGSDVFVCKLDATGNFVWAKQMSGSSDEYSFSIAVDQFENVYTTGMFTGTVDFDPDAGTSSFSSAGSSDIFISKLDMSGGLVWVRRFGATGQDFSNSIKVDDAGNIYTTGSFEWTVDFDPGAAASNLSSAGTIDVFVSKLDNAGDFVWAKRFGGSQDDIGHSITVDDVGQVHTTGVFRQTVDFDPGAGSFNLTSVAFNDVFVSKLDALGNFVWAKQFGGASEGYGQSIALDLLGNVYTSGNFYGTCDFDPGPQVSNLSTSSTIESDVFVSKLNSSGDHQWAKRVGSTSSDYSYSLVVDSDSSVYTVGNFGGTVDFNPGTGTYNLTAFSSNSDAFVLKLRQCETNAAITVTACDNYTWALNNQTYTTSGVYVDTIPNVAGCDSIVTLTLTVNYSSSSTDMQTACNSYAWIDGNTYTTSTNTATFTLTNITGCDSIVTLDLTILSNTGTDVQTACDSYTWIDGLTYTSSTNTPTFTLTNMAGCDSIVTLNLTVTYSTTGTDIQTACDSYTWIDGITYTSTTNTPTFTLTNAAGCDSIVTLDLTVNYSTTGTDVQTACDSYTWIDGNTYTASTNTPTFTLTNAAGCDSTVTLDLTVNYSTTGVDVQTACGPFTWIDGNTYTTSNSTATFTLTNAAGCDSIVTLNLTSNNTTGTDVQTACGSYTWIDGNTYTSSNNTATFTLTNAAGCDSIVTLDLTINAITSGTDVQTACGSYTWIDGNTYTSSNNTATFTLTNVAGCDSIVSLDLTINSATSGTDVQITCGSFTWIDGNTYTTSNNTATFTLTNAAGCDSVVTLSLTINTPSAGTDIQSTCSSYTWIDGNTYTSSNNTATFTLTNAAGCDSIVTLDLTITNSTTGIDVQTACGSYLWIDGITYTASTNSPTFTLTNAVGCDSTVTLNLTINAVPVAGIADAEVLIASGGTTFQWFDCITQTPIPGETTDMYFYTENGSYAVIVGNASGCTDTSDCIVIENIGIDEHNEAQISIFPNPTNDFVTLQFDGASALLNITDVQGKLIRSLAVSSGVKVDLSTFESGVYFFDVRTPSGQALKRITKI